jgi:hypothetical protein
MVVWHHREARQRDLVLRLRGSARKIETHRLAHKRTTGYSLVVAAAVAGTLIASTSGVLTGRPAAFARAGTSIQNHSAPTLGGTNVEGFSLQRTTPCTHTQDAGAGARACSSCMLHERAAKSGRRPRLKARLKRLGNPSSVEQHSWPAVRGKERLNLLVPSERQNTEELVGHAPEHSPYRRFRRRCVCAGQPAITVFSLKDRSRARRARTNAAFV